LALNFFRMFLSYARRYWQFLEELKSSISVRLRLQAVLQIPNQNVGEMLSVGLESLSHTPTCGTKDQTLQSLSKSTGIYFVPKFIADGRRKGDSSHGL